MKSVKGLTKKVMPGATMVAGGVIASKANGMLADKIVNPKARLALITGLGIFLMTQKGSVAQNIGAGVTTVAGMKLVGELAPNLGISDSDDYLSGLFDEVNTINDVNVNDDVNMGGIDTINGDGDGNDN